MATYKDGIRFEDDGQIGVAKTKETKQAKSLRERDEQRTCVTTVSKYLDIELGHDANNLVIQEFAHWQQGDESIRYLMLEPFGFNGDSKDRRRKAELMANVERKIASAEVGVSLDVEEFADRPIVLRGRDAKMSKALGLRRKAKPRWCKVEEHNPYPNILVFEVRKDWQPQHMEHLLDRTRMFVVCGICDELLEDMPRVAVERHFRAHAEPKRALYCHACDYGYETAEEAADHIASGCPIEIQYDSDFEDSDLEDEAKDEEPSVEDDATDDAPTLAEDASDDAPSVEDDATDTQESPAQPAARVARCLTCQAELDTNDTVDVVYHASGECRNAK